jgi:hypothetical protein
MYNFAILSSGEAERSGKGPHARTQDILEKEPFFERADTGAVTSSQMIQQHLRTGKT